MSADGFGAPVFVKSGKHLVQEIASIADTIDFLADWTESRHDMRAEAVLRACFDVQVGRKPASVVRENFIAFAKRAGIWEEPEAVMPWITAGSRSGGHVPA